jgi:predicted ester cyclase
MAASAGRWREVDSAGELAERLRSAYNAHAETTAAGLYRTDGRHRDIAMGGERVGHAEIGHGLIGLFTAIPDAHWTRKGMVVEGGAAVLTYELAGHLRARLGPYVPAGQPIRLEGVLVVEAEAGRITRTTDYWDSGALHRQLTSTTGVMA